jgi:hypothetical protein
MGAHSFLTVERFRHAFSFLTSITHQIQKKLSLSPNLQALYSVTKLLILRKMPPKKVGPGARANVDDLFRKERAEIFMDNDPRAGYEDDLESRIVYRRIESHIEELRIDQAWTKKRFSLLFWITLSFLGGEHVNY